MAQQTKEATQALLLLDDDEQVINDVVCSLRLLDTMVFSASSPKNGLSYLESEPIRLILVRVGLFSEPVSVLSSFQEQNENTDCAFIALGTPSELSRVTAEEAAFYVGSIELPVEFPDFTYRVQELFEQTPAQNKRLSARLEKQVASAPHLASGIDESSETGTGALLEDEDEEEAAIARRLAVAYAIQLEVLEELKRSRDFSAVTLEEISRIVADITGRVCSRFEPRKFFE